MKHMEGEQSLQEPPAKQDMPVSRIRPCGLSPAPSSWCFRGRRLGPVFVLVVLRFLQEVIVDTDLLNCVTEPRCWQPRAAQGWH